MEDKDSKFCGASHSKQKSKSGGFPTPWLVFLHLALFPEHRHAPGTECGSQALGRDLILLFAKSQPSNFTTAHNKVGLLF